MTQRRTWEAGWILDDGPLDEQEVVEALFVAIGELALVEPAYYDLNRRSQWRPYAGRSLIVDVLTQRTQLVTVIEDQRVVDGGKKVVLSTGKQDRPPQAVLRWREDWPPDQQRRQALWDAIEYGFDTLPLASFALRVADGPNSDPEDGALQWKAVGQPPASFNRWWQREISDE